MRLMITTNTKLNKQDYIKILLTFAFSTIVVLLVDKLYYMLFFRHVFFIKNHSYQQVVDNNIID